MVTGVGTPSLVERIVYLVQVPPLPLPGCPTTFKTSSTPLSSREEYVNLVFTSSSTPLSHHWIWGRHWCESTNDIVSHDEPFLILVVVTLRTSMFLYDSWFRLERIYLSPTSDNTPIPVALLRFEPELVGFRWDTIRRAWSLEAVSQNSFLHGDAISSLSPILKLHLDSDQMVLNYSFWFNS